MSLYDINEKTKVDEYGVCHKDFSLRDEIEYNMMRQNEKEQQIKNLLQSQHQIEKPVLSQSNNGNKTSFVNNLSNMYQEYFGERDYQNRYRTGCTPANIAYNTISNYQLSPNPKLIQSGNAIFDLGANFVASRTPIVKQYVRGEQIGNGVANIYNAMDKAGCFK